jgi:hypothetical protein
MRERLKQVWVPRHALDIWFAATLLDEFALTTAGADASFRDVAGDALRALLTFQGSRAQLPSRCWATRTHRGFLGWW